MNNLDKQYITDGITITKTKDGYAIFTIPTQHFNIADLDELTNERFERAISDLNKREELEYQLLQEIKPVQDLDWGGYIDGKHDNPEK